jgi:uridine kinase
LGELVALICPLSRAPILRVAIDGVDGAGKTTLADELAGVLRQSGEAVIRASVDGFHQPRSLRYQKGRDSPLGFFEDSYDYAQLKSCLLDPLSAGGSLRYRTAVFDHCSDQSLNLPEQQASPGMILLMDGIFLHRPELLNYWDFSVFVDVPFAVSLARLAQRDGSPSDPEHPAQRRYVEGQKIYLQRCQPQRKATYVLDNQDLQRPKLE